MEEKKLNMKRQKRLEFLTQLTNGLICIEDVAILLSCSLPNCRKYRYLGIIKPVNFDKQRHLYDLGEIREVKENLVKLKIEHDLAQTAVLFKKSREEKQKNYPKGYPWPMIPKEEKTPPNTNNEKKATSPGSQIILKSK